MSKLYISTYRLLTHIQYQNFSLFNMVVIPSKKKSFNCISKQTGKSTNKAIKITKDKTGNE